MKVDPQLEKKFEELSAQWRKETGGCSLISAKIANPNYLKIIAMGEAVVPLILRSLLTQPDHWFAALEALTGEKLGDRPINFNQAVSVWLDWGCKKGLIDIPTKERAEPSCEKEEILACREFFPNLDWNYYPHLDANWDTYKGKIHCPDFILIVLVPPPGHPNPGWACQTWTGGRLLFVLSGRDSLRQTLHKTQKEWKGLSSALMGNYSYPLAESLDLREIVTTANIASAPDPSSEWYLTCACARIEQQLRVITDYPGYLEPGSKKWWRLVFEKLEYPVSPSLEEYWNREGI